MSLARSLIRAAAGVTTGHASHHMRPTLLTSSSICLRGIHHTAAVASSAGGGEGGGRLEPSQSESLLDFGTRRLFDEDHDLMREMTRKFYENECAPFHAQWEKDGMVSRELWEAAGANGLLGIPIPEEYGGPGGDILQASIMWEEQGASGYTGPGFAIHSDIVLPYILHYGTEEQKQKYLPPACAGTCITAIAMTEPGAGSDLQGVNTRAVRDGDDYIINGSKIFITNGQMCDMVVVVAKTDPNAKRAAHGISLFMVDANTPGFEKGKNLNKVGFKAQDTSELFFSDCRVPASALLGEENKGFYYLMQELPQERLLIGGIAVAKAEACYEWTRTYIKDRKAFGGELAQLQTIRHKMADLKTDIAVGRTFYDRCLELHAQGQLDGQMASMAKMWLTDLEGRVADACVQLHGGYGFMWEYPIARAFADARVQRIYGGSNEIMKELISRTI